MLFPRPMRSHGGFGTEVQPFPRLVLVGDDGHACHLDLVGLDVLFVDLMGGNEACEILRRHQHGQICVCRCL